MPDEKDNQDIDERDDIDLEEEDGEDGDDDSGAESGASDKDDKKSSEDSEEESKAEKYKKRMQAADRRAAAAEQKVREIENAGKPESEKLQAELDEAKSWRTDNEPKLAQLRLENAFLKTNELTWQNAGVAVSVARDGGYLEDVVDDETGEVDQKALKVALSKLARDHEYLVKRQRQRTGGGSGEPGPEGGKDTSGKDKKQKDASLRRRLPALGSR